MGSSASVQLAEGLYDLLLGSSVDVRTILFCWWPRSEEWCREALVQRSTECLPAVRPGLDLVALPVVPEVRDLWDVWRLEHGLQEQQAIWFQARLDGGVAEDQAAAACGEVLASLVALSASPQPPVPVGSVNLYPAFATASFCAEASSKGLAVIGGPEEEGPRLLPVQHPHVSGARQSSSGCVGALPPVKVDGVRFLKGYAVSSLDGLREAYAFLRQECPMGCRFMLKRSEASGAPGPTAISGEKDLDTATDISFGTPAVLEEAPPCGDQEGVSTLYMVGSEPCPWPVNSHSIPEYCVEAAREINRSTMLEGHWGLEFAVDPLGELVITGIRTCAPCQSISVQLWASRSVHPVALATAGCSVPREGAASIKEIMALLHSEELVWDGDEGVIVYQCAPGSVLSFVIASSFGSGAVKILYEKLGSIMLASFGLRFQ